MKSIKLAVIAALSSFAVSAFALAPMQDSDLSAVSGQDGVSIAANLKIDIGAFTYTDTDSAGGSIAFNDIKIRGVVGVTIDIVNATTFATAMTGLGVNTAQAGTTGFYTGGDVVQIALPDVAVAGTPNADIAGRTTNNLAFSVGSVKMSNSTKSFGSFAMTDIKMQGTTAFIWAH